MANNARPKFIAFHGYTMNRGQLRTMLEPAFSDLDIELIIPDAPHTCRPESVRAFFREWKQPIPEGPHLTWWRASDDGRRYEGLEDTIATLRALHALHTPHGVIGFSQGTMVAAVACALSELNELPPLRCAILLAGAPPRADALEPLFRRPIAVPSLHIWGERDPLAGHAPTLVERFDAATRSTHTWEGSHNVPRTGAGVEAIREFVTRHCNG